VRVEDYEIECAKCGYRTQAFNGWTFVASVCREPGEPGLLHVWRELEGTAEARPTTTAVGGDLGGSPRASAAPSNLELGDEMQTHEFSYYGGTFRLPTEFEIRQAIAEYEEGREPSEREDALNDLNAHLERVSK
jgi:hypothetical protein